jgi:small subunit ribosomal protein S8
MSVTDPIADMLVRMRNAMRAGLEVVEMPHSRMRAEIARVLKRESFVTDYVVEGGTRKTIRVYLRYDAGRRPCIRGLRRDSKPGLRRYVGADRIPRVLNGMGVAILSTPSGVLTDKEARGKHVGGELLCSVW